MFTGKEYSKDLPKKIEEFHVYRKDLVNVRHVYVESKLLISI